MSQPVHELAGFTVLPITFPKTAAFRATTHYVYLKPHDPRIPDPSAARSLFLMNIPVTTTESHLKHLFNTQLGSGRVEEVHFGEARAQKVSVVNQARISEQRKNRKRKRETMEDHETALEACRLPEVWENDVHASGAHAVVVFVDRASREASLKAAKRVAKRQPKITWGEGMGGLIPKLGLHRYEAHNQLRYPPRKELLQSVDDYITNFTKLEEGRSRAEAKKRQIPDEDGFITVTKGTRGGVIRRDEAKELGQKQKGKEKGLEDFYRFQMRSKRKEQQGQLIRQFEEDRKKISEMKSRRGRLRPD